MKKSIKAIILSLVIIASVLVCVFHTDLYVRSYPKDRITGKYTVTLDRNPVDYCVWYTSDSQNQEKPCGGNGTVGVKGGEYGIYKIILSPEDDAEKSLPDIELDIFNTNWWNIIHFELNSDIKSVGKENILDADLTYSYYSCDIPSTKETVKTSLRETAENRESTGFLIQFEA